ncbi:heavy metal translocating P-type ATPase [Chromobacterium sp. IIBBL 290-4]|uniref:heavy metal translocating P-type ATPase n=1 Tax=Chromobacterium sp. IIBBL 290-4 TaxID=2953890 RepID=UPI0020B85C87|nr:heavy metal translocating P-type ATPase [Chromobacterium sp. IIBBL 290-4]UTH73853.1 heavy metal translocating P-type ATPase [Chromobacterium sp. IIBBL 290-4]
MSENCFHCGLPVPSGAHFPILYRQREEAACCAGCQAVASTIIQSGLADYYQHRTEGAARAEALPDTILEQIKLYDSDELQQSFVHTEDGQRREAALMLEGVTCAACIWLNEQHLRQLPGVLSVDINYSTQRARVCWDNKRIQLSAILEAVAAIGYRAHPYDAERQEKLQQKERKQALARLWVAGLSMMQVMMYAVPVYLAPDGDIAPDFLWLLHWASFILTLPVLLYSALPFYRNTWRDLKTLRVGMDTPVTIGILTAFIASFWALIHKFEHGIYFDSVSMFVFLLLGGRYLEGIARRKAGAASESLVKLVPAFCHRLAHWPASRDSHEATVASLRAGDVVLVKPGETIPADGVVLEGKSSSDESLLTGESRPIAKLAGDALIAGSVNAASPLVMRVEHAGQTTRLAGIVRLLDQALSEKPRLARVADRYASWFVALLLLAAAASYIGWHFIEPDRALWIMVAVLVISCPCALSLATPAALTAAAGHLASLGVLTTRGHALETLAKATDAVFDKTGTLTYGRMRLIAYQGRLAREQALPLAAALEQGSEHPLAQAISQAAQSLPPAQAEAHANQPGHGLAAMIGGQEWRLGSAPYIGDWLDQPLADDEHWHPECTQVWLANASGVQGRFAIGDACRDDAAELIQALRARGLRPHLLSGDGEAAVASLAAQLGINDWRARAAPEDKLAFVSQLQAQGRKVVMVGDGVNDAPVLARADVSIAMGGGTDVARASGDMVLIGDRLGLIGQAVDLSRRTLRVIRQNLLWAAGYNIVALPLAVSGHVTPWLASLGMALSSLLVVGNALRLIKRDS